MNQNEITDLIIKSKLELASKEEISMLEKWCNESVSNREIYDQFLHDHAIRKKYSERASTNTDLYYQKFVESTTHHYHQRWIRWTSYAALLFLLLGSSFLLYVSLQDSQTSIGEPYYSENAVSLTVGNTQILLSKSDSGTVPTNDRSVEANVKNKNLSYIEKDREKEVSSQIVEHHLRIPRGAEFNVTLADGTKVWLNAESELIYPSRFDGKSRRVYLKGEAYFSVPKRKGSTFHVITDDLDVTVLGTSFSVKSYKGDQYREVILESGKVIATCNDSAIALVPNQKLSYRVDKQLIKVDTVDAKRLIGWLDGYYNFDRKPLVDIAKDLSRWYDVNVICASEEVGDIQFTGSIKKSSSIEEMLEVIAKTDKIEILRKENQFVITRMFR